LIKNHLRTRRFGTKKGSTSPTKIKERLAL
jgi:hypothetical protein